MGLTGNLVKHVEIKPVGDLFFQLYSQKQTEISNLVPQKVHGCDLIQGQRGVPASIISWDYTLDGKRQLAKCVMDVNYRKKSIKFTVIGGDLMDEFKTFVVTILVDTNSITHNTVTWDAEFEKKNKHIEDPHSLMDFFEDMTNEVVDRI